MIVLRSHISLSAASSVRSARVRITIFVFACLLSFLWVSTAHAENRYWVGTRNADNDRFEDTENWSTLPAGASGASIPGSSDIAIFSSSGNTVRFRSAVNVAGLEMTAAWTGSVLQGTGTLTVGTSDFLVGSGTFVGGNATIALADAYSQTGGIVRGIQNTMTLSGAFSITDGGGSGIPNPTFTSTGTLTFDGSADQNFTVGANTNTTFVNLILNNTGGATSDDIVTNVNGGLVLSGTLTITLGNLDMTTNSIALTISGGLTIADVEQATLTTNSNVTASGTITINRSSSLSSTAGTWTLETNDQTIDVNNASIANLTIASSSGATLSSNLTVPGTTQVNAGSTLTLSSNTLFATGGTITNLGTIAENTGKIVHTPNAFIIADSSFAEVGSITLGGTVFFSLTEGDKNLDATTAETVSITATTANGDSETITLTESTVSSGIFQSSIPSADITGGSLTQENGTLESAATDTLTITFTDAKDGIVSTDTATLADSATTTSDSSSTATSSGGGGGGGGSRRAAAILQAMSTGDASFAGRRWASDRLQAIQEEDLKEIQKELTVEQRQQRQRAPWSDFRSNHPHAAATLRLFDAGIVKGNDDGTVQLDRSLSRVEALTLLTRTLEEEEKPNVQLPFHDINPEAWYAAPLQIALALGIIQGFPDGSFRPADQLNLVQSLKILSIALGLASQEDEAKTGIWYDPYVTAGREAGLIRGKLVYNRNVSRGEFFSWLVRVLED